MRDENEQKQCDETHKSLKKKLVDGGWERTHSTTKVREKCLKDKSFRRKTILLVWVKEREQGGKKES